MTDALDNKLKELHYRWLMEEIVNRSIGYLVVALRKRKGWSQVRLAKEAQVYRNGVKSVESGKGNPTLATLIKLFDALGYGMEIRLKPHKKGGGTDG